MPAPVQDQITANLNQAKQEGQLRADRIKSIVAQAVSETRTELAAGSQEVGSLVKDVVSTVVDTLQDRGETLKEDVQAAIEGTLDALNQTRREKISAAETQMKQLQAAIETEETALQSELDSALTSLGDQPSQRSEQVKGAIAAAVETVRDSEEAQLMQKRYAQLRTQMAILKANLAARYETGHENAQQYLDEAKSWYERVSPKLEATSDTVSKKRTAFEKQMTNAGKALAQKEVSLKQTLKELWQSSSEIFKE
ncbi:MAG: histidine kinase [Cyanobacteria bacterium P01_A01_bin.114]